MSKSVHVAIIGAAGGIGQPLSLLLANQLPDGSKLSLYDVVGAAGVATDLSHIDCNVTICHGQGSTSTTGPCCPELERIAADDVDIFVIVAGMARKPGMTRQDLFAVNAGICLNIILTCGKVAKKTACYCIVTNPVNSTVPIAAEALKSLKAYDPNRLFGITTLDVIRTTTFLNNNANNNKHNTVKWTDVPVVGGHSHVTIVPLLSQLSSVVPPDVATQITQRVQVAGNEVVEAKAGKGSATLSMAAAGARFVMVLVAALTTGTAQQPTVVYSYVDTLLSSGDAAAAADCQFYALPVRLGQNGIEERLPIGPVNDYEQSLLVEANRVIQENVDAGTKFARSKL